KSSQSQLTDRLVGKYNTPYHPLGFVKESGKSHLIFYQRYQRPYVIRHLALYRLFSLFSPFCIPSYSYALAPYIISISITYFCSSNPYNKIPLKQRHVLTVCLRGIHIVFLFHSICLPRNPAAVSATFSSAFVKVSFSRAAITTAPIGSPFAIITLMTYPFNSSSLP